MPDLHWSRWGYLCEDFGQDICNRKVVDGSVFRCRSRHDNGERFEAELRRTLNGENLGDITADMQLAEYSLEGNHLVLHKGERFANVCYWQLCAGSRLGYTQAN